MKRVLKRVGIGLLVLVGLAFVGFVVIEIRGIPKYPVERVELKVEVTPEKVARGKRWVTLLCAECHADATTQRLTGKLLADAPSEFGPLYSKNITKHPEKGIGKWTDGELAYLIRTGLRKDGQYVPPPMPKLELMSDEDLDSIIAFLRSDDDLVAASDVDDKESEPSFLVKFLCTVAWKPRAWPKQKIVTPSKGDVLAYGKYLTDNLLCHECHSKDFKSNKMPPETSDGYMGGGNMLLDWSNRKIYTPNITMDEATGIGKWNDAQFRRAMTDGFRPDDTPIVYPMPKTPELEEAELNAMYAYLKTVPKISNTRKPAEYQAPGGISGGKAVYYKYRCDGCHGDTGVGSCDLRKAREKYPTPELMTAFIKNPRSAVPGSHMPPWEGVIKDDELGPLAEYVSTLGAGR